MDKARAAHVLLVAFSLQFVALDLALRGIRPWLDHPNLVFTAIQSGCLWALAALASRRLALRVVTASLASSVFVVQCLFFGHFSTLMDAEVVRSTLRFWADIKPTLSPLLPRLALLAIAGAIVEFFWLKAACADSPRPH
jgi:hypothetical protein